MNLLKLTFARLRWGRLDLAQIEKIKNLSFGEVFAAPYINRKY